MNPKCPVLPNAMYPKFPVLPNAMYPKCPVLPNAMYPKCQVLPNAIYPKCPVSQVIISYSAFYGNRLLRCFAALFLLTILAFLLHSKSPLFSHSNKHRSRIFLSKLVDFKKFINLLCGQVIVPTTNLNPISSAFSHLINTNKQLDK